MYKLEGILKETVGRGGSDLHLCSQSPAIIRVFGKLQKLDSKVITTEEAESMISEILSEDQKNELALRKNIDFAFEIDYGGNSQRFRCNVYFQKYGVNGVFRVIPSQIPGLSQLLLPAQLEQFAYCSEGLILITGSAGSGKSTTMAAILDIINSRQKLHIITIEDPIEYVHPIKQCLVNQRQVGLHTKSFTSALKAAIREDPDIIVVGEMRDTETVQLAIAAAETGHCVFGTMHTTGAIRTIDRIIDSFPIDQQQQIRTLLAETLRGVIGLQLLSRTDGWGMMPAVEIMIGNNAISNIIREGRTHQIHSVMQTGKAMGMQLMDDDIHRLLREGKISPETAYERAMDKKLFEAFLKNH